MRVVGIIAEYNPFHNGHKYHLEQSLAMTGADCSVAVMSGNFLQRGEPALWDKRIRAEMAVENGVDLVLELPFVFACNNAEQFAYGGVSLLNSLGCVTDLAFGCEGDLAELQKTVDRIAYEEEDFKGHLSEALSQGMSYPSARTAALSACGDESGAKLLTEPNNILAAEYLKQCILTDSQMKPWGIRRVGSGYNSMELSGTCASARAIRKEWNQSHSMQSVEAFLPPATTRIIEGIDPEDNLIMEALYQLIAARIRTLSKEELSHIWAVTEGMENLLKKAVVTATDMESLIATIKTKRYTQTRLQRVLMQTLMGLTRDDYEQILAGQVHYAHVLAFSSKGAKLLKEIKKKECAGIPIYSNLSKEVSTDAKEQILLKYDLLATDLYHLGQKKQIYAHSDLVLAPYHKKY